MACLYMLILTFFLVQCMSFKTRLNKDEIRVDGNDFVSVNLRQRPGLFSLKKHTLRFELKTMNPNGMLVYIGSGHKKIFLDGGFNSWKLLRYGESLVLIYMKDDVFFLSVTNVNRSRSYDLPISTSIW